MLRGSEVTGRLNDKQLRGQVRPAASFFHDASCKHKPLVTHKNSKTRLDVAWKHLKAPAQLRKRFSGQMKPHLFDFKQDFACKGAPPCLLLFFIVYFVVYCLLGDKHGIFSQCTCMWLYLLLCTRQQTVPGEGRKVVQEGCSCVNRSSMFSSALCFKSPQLLEWLEVHEVLVKDRTKCTQHTCFVW